MANRYWVGGTANWDGTAGTKWSDTSGGSGGFSVPTTADDVFFSAGSTGTVTIATGNTGAKSINCTGFTGTLTGGVPLTVAGSITLVAGMTYSYNGTLTLTGTGTLTSAAKTFGAITINGSGITVTLGDALTMGALTLTTGTFTTSNYNFTGTSFNSSNSNNRTVNLGSSTLTLSGSTPINMVTTTNLTFNAGTSQINCTSASNINTGAGNLTFYNVAFTNLTAGNTATLAGSSTFNNLSVTANGAGLTQLIFQNNQTINGTLSFSGTSVFNRGFIRSNVLGTVITLTVNTLTTNDCDFEDITISGTAAGTAPTRAGNCGGNSGITFPAAKNAYRVGTDTTWIGSSSWALSSGSTGADNNFPLPQDTAVIDEGTALTGTLSLAAYNISGLNCTNRTTGITLAHGTVVTRYGAYILGPGVTVSGTSAQTFDIRSTPATFTSAGKTITFTVAIASITTGGISLGDAFTSSSNIVVTSGTFDANNYNLTCLQFNSTGSSTRTINMGSGLWTITGTGSLWSITSTGLTFNKNTANILLSDTTAVARTFTGSTQSYNKLTIGGATGTSTLTINGALSFTELASTKTVAHTITLSSNLGTIGTWSVKGTSGNVVTLNSSVVGTRRTFSLTNQTISNIDYFAVKDIGVNETNRFYVGANSTDNGNNSNVYFTVTPNPDVDVAVTGVAGTGQVGDITVSIDVAPTITGVEGTGQVGDVSILTDQILSVTGVVGTGQIGDVSVSIDVALTITGVAGTGQVGDVVVLTDQVISVTGVEGTGQVGDVLILTDQILSVTGVVGTGQIGNVTLLLDIIAYPSGVSATGQVGDIAVLADQVISVTGVSGTGIIGQTLVWGVILTPQDPNWTPIVA